MTRYLIAFLVILAGIAARRSDPHPVPFRPTARPTLTTVLPVVVAPQDTPAPVLPTPETAQDCPLDWSLPESDGNYEWLAFCRFVHYERTGIMACPPPDSVWYGRYFQDAYCAPPPWFVTPTPFPLPAAYP